MWKKGLAARMSSGEQRNKIKGGERQTIKEKMEIKKNQARK